tara:strand:+ start:979 stop:1401 length:423 start_codon:yes stop_codon:yes gene_type:complete
MNTSILIGIAAASLCMLVFALMTFVIFPRIASRPAWWLPRSVKNWLGRAIGYGHCKCCRDTWNWQLPHRTAYSYEDDEEALAAVFPLCESCWRELATPERRQPYYDALTDEWLSMAEHHVRMRIEQEDKPAIQKAVNKGQ